MIYAGALTCGVKAFNMRPVPAVNVYAAHEKMYAGLYLKRFCERIDPEILAAVVYDALKARPAYIRVYACHIEEYIISLLYKAPLLARYDVARREVSLFWVKFFHKVPSFSVLYSKQPAALASDCFSY